MELADGEGGEGDETGYTTTLEDLRLQEVYVYWLHTNSSTHLDGGIGDDAAWQAWWRDLVVMPFKRYDVSRGKIGRRFVKKLGEELIRVRYIQWNS